MERSMRSGYAAIFLAEPAKVKTIPIPQSYLLGMDLQHSVVENGFHSFLLGENAQRGWLHFYIVAFFLKTPVAADR
jgi:hypothetical protein